MFLEFDITITKSHRSLDIWGGVKESILRNTLQMYLYLLHCIVKITVKMVFR